jgi:hypothetical protein
MKKTEILKELKEIKELISKNLISAWERDLGSTIDAVALEDFEEGTEEEPVTLEYNGWRDRFETLIKALDESKETRISVMADNIGNYCGWDELPNFEEFIEKLQAIEDKSQMLDTVLDDEGNDCVYICEAFEFTFTVKSFLEQIDTYVAD